MQTLSTVVELAGLAAVLVGAYLVTPALGLVVAGAYLTAIGTAIGRAR